MIFKRCSQTIRRWIHRIDRATADYDYQALFGWILVILSFTVLPVQIIALGLLGIGLFNIFHPFVISFSSRKA